MMGESKTFSQLDISQRFHLKGVGYIKHTHRTAKVLSTGAVVRIPQKQEVCPVDMSFFK